MTKVAVTKVAVIGLGVIGGNMARRLLDAGFAIAVFNRSTGRRDPFRSSRAVVAADPAAAAEGAAFVIVSVTDAAAVREVVLGTRGVVEGAAAGTLVINTSTVGPSSERALAEELRGSDIRYMDAPVTGGAEAAKNGTLTMLCGGREDDFRDARPVLEHVGRKIVLMGPVGAGQLTKAVNQVILAGTLLGVSEGMALARAVGLDLDIVIDALREGGAASWVLSNRAAFMARRDFPPAGRMALHLKDLDIALASSSDVALELPGARLVRDLERRLVDAGHADEDISALVRAYESGARRRRAAPRARRVP